MRTLAKVSRPKPSSRSRSARPANALPPADDLREAVIQLKRERIVAAAIDLFYRQGYARTTLDQVAEALQVTKPFIYQYFTSKQDLLAEICSRAIKVSHQVLDRAAAREGTPTARLKAIARDFMQTVLEHQANAVIYSQEEKELAPKDREAIRTLRRKFDHRLVALIQEGVDSGEFEVEDVQLAALAIGGIVGWSQVWFRSNGRLTREEASDRISSLVLAMVMARQAPRQRG
jgi:TetR/AcrR family transcriptional regulator, cholesterol catabolism regulator